MGVRRVGSILATLPLGDPACIQVLPLMTGATRSRPAPRASAALFVNVKGGGGRAAEALATVFAEVPVTDGRLAGRSAAEIAEALGIALPTVRTHLANIYTKTDTARQSDAIRLAAPPLSPARTGPGVP